MILFSSSLCNEVIYCTLLSESLELWSYKGYHERDVQAGCKDLYSSQTEHDILVMPDADGLSSETVRLLFVCAECLSASAAPMFTSNVSVSQTYS